MFFIQFFSWHIGITITYLGKIEYPVRLFPKAVDSSFLHGYISNPLIFAMYYLHYPKQAKLIWRCMYTLVFTGIPVFIEIIESYYTNLINYKSWSGYYSWIVIVIPYFIIRKYLNWFFKNISKQGVSVNET